MLTFFLQNKWFLAQLWQHTRGRGGPCSQSCWENHHVKRNMNRTWKRNWWQGQLTGLGAGTIDSSLYGEDDCGGQQYKGRWDGVGSGREAGWRREGHSLRVLDYYSMAFLLFGSRPLLLWLGPGPFIFCRGRWEALGSSQNSRLGPLLVTQHYDSLNSYTSWQSNGSRRGGPFSELFTSWSRQ